MSVKELSANGFDCHRRWLSTPKIDIKVLKNYKKLEARLSPSGLGTLKLGNNSSSNFRCI